MAKSGTVNIPGTRVPQGGHSAFVPAPLPPPFEDLVVLEEGLSQMGLGGKDEPISAGISGTVTQYKGMGFLTLIGFSGWTA